MKIAVIGGGASGMIAAYLLSCVHEVHVFEAENHLGGNIKTVNGNVSGKGLPCDIKIENGVLGFHEATYPKFHSLMRHLKVTLLQSEPSTTLFTDTGCFPANKKTLWKLIKKEVWQGRFHYLTKIVDLNKSKKNVQNYLLQSRNLEIDILLKNFVDCLFMLGFSTPHEDVDRLPNTLTIPFWLNLEQERWSFVQGGVYHYIERIIENFSGQIHLGSQVQTVRRSIDGVKIILPSREFSFDQVIIATTPGVVLDLLEAPASSEKRIFKPWSDRIFQTIAHGDLSMYGNLQDIEKTPMDLFYRPQQGLMGYNTYMNTSYKLPVKHPYSFAYNLADVIAQDKVYHVADHRVPVYGDYLGATQQKISEINGKNRTFFVGAYLGNGLHEGAVTSALSVSRILGGMLI